MTERHDTTNAEGGDLDTRLRSMLADKATEATVSSDAWEQITRGIEHGTPVPVTALDSRRPFFGARIAAAAAAVVALVATGVLVATRADEAPLDTSVADGGDAAQPAPDGPPVFDPPAGVSADHVLFPLDETYDSADEVAVLYLRDRLGPTGPDLLVEPAEADVDSPELATVRWRTTEEGGTVLAEGTLWLWNTGETWAVQAATMDDLDVDATTVTGSVVHVTGSTTSDQALAWRVFHHDGTPVTGPAGERRPLDDRFDDAVRLLDDPIPAIVRFEYLGGTTLGIAEFPVTVVAPPHLSDPVSVDADEQTLAELGATAVLDHVGLQASADPYVDDDRQLPSVVGGDEPRVVVVPTGAGDYLVGIERVAGDIGAEGQSPVGAVGVTQIVAAELEAAPFSFREADRIEGQVTAPAVGILEVGASTIEGDPIGGASVPAEAAGEREWNLSIVDVTLDPIVLRFTFLAEDGRTFEAVTIA